MNSIDLQARDLLLHRRKTLSKLFAQNRGEEDRIQQERESDWPDQALAQETAQLLESLSDQERAELGEIDAALERIRKGVYGRCERCAGPIGRQRLKAIPEARLCIGCGEQPAHR